MLSNLREIAFFFRVYYRPCSIIYWLPLWKLFIGGPICGDIYEACLRLYVSCSTHDYISKTKQDRPIVIMKHCIERSTMSHLDPLPGAPLADIKLILISHKKYFVQCVQISIRPHVGVRPLSIVINRAQPSSYCRTAGVANCCKPSATVVTCY